MIPPPPRPPTHHPKPPHLDPPPGRPPQPPPPPHRPSLNPPPPPPPLGAFGPLLLGGGVASKSEETSPPWFPCELTTGPGCLGRRWRDHSRASVLELLVLSPMRTHAPNDRVRPSTRATPCSLSCMACTALLHSLFDCHRIALARSAPYMRPQGPCFTMASLLASHWPPSFCSQKSTQYEGRWGLTLFD